MADKNNDDEKKYLGKLPEGPFSIITSYLSCKDIRNLGDVNKYHHKSQPSLKALAYNYFQKMLNDPKQLSKRDEFMEILDKKKKKLKEQYIQKLEQIIAYNNNSGFWEKLGYNRDTENFDRDSNEFKCILDPYINCEIEDSLFCLSYYDFTNYEEDIDDNFINATDKQKQTMLKKFLLLVSESSISKKAEETCNFCMNKGEVEAEDILIDLLKKRLDKAQAQKENFFVLRSKQANFLTTIDLQKNKIRSLINKEQQKFDKPNGKEREFTKKILTYEIYLKYPELELFLQVPNSDRYNNKIQEVYNEDYIVRALFDGENDVTLNLLKQNLIEIYKQDPVFTEINSLYADILPEYIKNPRLLRYLDKDKFKNLLTRLCFFADLQKYLTDEEKQQNFIKELFETYLFFYPLQILLDEFKNDFYYEYEKLVDIFAHFDNPTVILNPYDIVERRQLLIGGICFIPVATSVIFCALAGFWTIGTILGTICFLAWNWAYDKYGRADVWDRTVNILIVFELIIVCIMIINFWLGVLAMGLVFVAGFISHFYASILICTNLKVKVKVKLWDDNCNLRNKWVELINNVESKLGGIVPIIMLVVSSVVFIFSYCAVSFSFLPFLPFPLSIALFSISLILMATITFNLFVMKKIVCNLGERGLEDSSPFSKVQGDLQSAKKKEVMRNFNTVLEAVNEEKKQQNQEQLQAPKQEPESLIEQAPKQEPESLIETIDK